MIEINPLFENNKLISPELTIKFIDRISKKIGVKSLSEHP